jgi:hypothetical protein
MDSIVVDRDTDGLSVVPIESDLSSSNLPANETTDMPVETNNTTHDQDVNSKISETNDLVKDIENVKPPLASIVKVFQQAGLIGGLLSTTVFLSFRFH